VRHAQRGQRRIQPSRRLEAHLVPGAVARLVRLDYKPEAAQDSWRRILAFFSEHLQG